VKDGYPSVLDDLGYRYIIINCITRVVKINI